MVAPCGTRRIDAVHVEGHRRVADLGVVGRADAAQEHVDAARIAVLLDGEVRHERLQRRDVLHLRAVELALRDRGDRERRVLQQRLPLGRRHGDLLDLLDRKLLPVAALLFRRLAGSLLLLCPCDACGKQGHGRDPPHALFGRHVYSSVVRMPADWEFRLAIRAAWASSRAVVATVFSGCRKYENVVKNCQPISLRINGWNIAELMAISGKRTECIK
jgi:hypothetical protein